ncbi:MAG: SOS response-associated peptidase [Gemmatimonadetes bacterium]|nr:SOS response-associated peptidase [Gemmatimonadota bacterium]
MCGRYGIANPARLTALPLGVTLPDYLEARFNIAPSSAVPLLTEERDGRHLRAARWGLVPFWADDPAIGNRLANARAESVATKPSFRQPFQKRRGLMLADLYYEWQVVPGRKSKQPWCVRLPGDAPFAMAALWERWRPKTQPDAEPLVTCCVITTDANEAMQVIHDRMPVIVHERDYARWLDPDTPGEEAQALLTPWTDALVTWPVSTRVNMPSFDDPQLLEPVTPRAARPGDDTGDTPPDVQPTLFP